MNSLKKLLLNTPESFYWMGFIMADGTFVKNRFKLGISNKDHTHIEKLYNYLNCNNTLHVTETHSYFSIMDTKNVSQLKEKFDFNQSKTYYPPKTIKWMENDLLISFIIGFIDGDGSITKQYKRKDPILRIKLHSSWIHILDEISTFLCEKSKTPIIKSKINNQGYSQINLANHKLLKYLKKELIRLKIPHLERKWSLIDDNLINKTERSKINLEKVKVLLEKGYSDKLIREELNLKPSTLSLMISRNKLR